MKHIVSIFILFYSFSAFSNEENCRTEYTGDMQKIISINEKKWGSDPVKYDMTFYVTKELSGKSLYRVAVRIGTDENVKYWNYLELVDSGSKKEFRINFQESYLNDIWIVIFWGQDCGIFKKFKLEYNQALKVQPSAAGTPQSGAP